MSQPLFEIKATNDSPYVSIDAEKHEIWLKGVSMPENAFEFYAPVIDRIDSAFSSPSKEITVRIELDYLNSMSNKQLLRLLMKLESEFQKGRVIWRFRSSDDLMQMKGEELSAICPGLHFEMESVG